MISKVRKKKLLRREVAWWPLRVYTPTFLRAHTRLYRGGGAKEMARGTRGNWPLFPKVVVCIDGCYGASGN